MPDPRDIIDKLRHGDTDEPTKRWRMDFETSVNMILMMLAYAQRTRDVGYIHRHWLMMDMWGKFLIQEGPLCFSPKSPL